MRWHLANSEEGPPLLSTDLDEGEWTEEGIMQLQSDPCDEFDMEGLDQRTDQPGVNCTMIANRRVEARNTYFFDQMGGMAENSAPRRLRHSLSPAKVSMGLFAVAMFLVSLHYTRRDTSLQQIAHAPDHDVVEEAATAEHCWVPCGGKAGPCDWCGEGKACCRFGSAIDASIAACQNVEQWGTKYWHTCVASGTTSHAEVDPEMVLMRNFEIHTNFTELAERLGGEDGQEAPGREMSGNWKWYSQSVVDAGSVHDAGVDLAQCSIDILQAATSLGQAGTAITATTKVCKSLWSHPWSHKYGTTEWIDHSTMVDGRQATCSAAVSSVISSFVFSGAFIADAAANCALGYNLNARCAGNVAWLAGSFAQLASAGSAVTQVCEKGYYVNPVAIDGRRLSGENLGNFTAEDLDPEHLKKEAIEWQRRLGKVKLPHAHPSKHPVADAAAQVVAGITLKMHKEKVDDKKLEMAECIFDAQQATWFYARASTMIARAARDCGNNYADACMVDLEYMLNALILVGAYISYAVEHCQPIREKHALCAATILKAVGSIVGATAAASDFLRTCQGISNEPYPPPNVGGTVDTGGGSDSSGGSGGGGSVVLTTTARSTLPPINGGGGGEVQLTTTARSTLPPINPATTTTLAPSPGPPTTTTLAPAPGPDGTTILVEFTTTARPTIPGAPTAVREDNSATPWPGAVPLPPEVVPAPIEITTAAPIELTTMAPVVASTIPPVTTTAPTTAAPTTVTVTSTTTVTTTTVTTTTAVHPVSSAPLLTFYVYRAQTTEDYDLRNVNAGNMAGILWYLQHDIIQPTGGARYGMKGLARYKVQVRAPQKLFNKGMNFGIRFGYNDNTCQGPGSCESYYQEYGDFVGCNDLGTFPYPNFQTYFSNGAWYSFPQGGLCMGTPTGADDCTYSYEGAGFATVEEIENGEGHDFWKDPKSVEANDAKTLKAQQVFERKYPNVPGAIPSPTCDFNQGVFYGNGH